MQSLTNTPRDASHTAPSRARPKRSPLARHLTAIAPRAARRRKTKCTRGRQPRAPLLLVGTPESDAGVTNFEKYKWATFTADKPGLMVAAYAAERAQEALWEDVLEVLGAASREYHSYYAAVAVQEVHKSSMSLVECEAVAEEMWVTCLTTAP